MFGRLWDVLREIRADLGEVRRLLALVEMRMPSADVLSPAEAQALYGWHPTTLYRWVAAGKLQRLRRAGGGVGYLRAELETLWRGRPETTEARGRRRAA